MTRSRSQKSRSREMESGERKASALHALRSLRRSGESDAWSKCTKHLQTVFTWYQSYDSQLSMKPLKIHRRSGDIELKVHAESAKASAMATEDNEGLLCDLV